MNLLVSMSNINYTFGKYPVVAAHAIKLLTSTRDDMRSLTIAFSNELINLKREYDEDGYAFLTEPELNGPEEVIILAMSRMFELALKYSPFRVKWNYKIPKWALKNVESFKLFDESFDFENTNTVEELKAQGCK